MGVNFLVSNKTMGRTAEDERFRRAMLLWIHPRKCLREDGACPGAGVQKPGVANRDFVAVAGQALHGFRYELRQRHGRAVIGSSSAFVQVRVDVRRNQLDYLYAGMSQL